MIVGVLLRNIKDTFIFTATLMCFESLVYFTLEVNVTET